MVKEKVKYNIISVPAQRKFIDYPADFPRLGRLYLELLENKEKVKDELKNVEYVPKQPAADIEEYIEQNKAKIQEDTADDIDQSEKSYDYNLDHQNMDSKSDNRDKHDKRDRLDDKIDSFIKGDFSEPNIMEKYRDRDRHYRDKDRHYRDKRKKHSKSKNSHSKNSDYSEYSDYSDYSDYSHSNDSYSDYSDYSDYSHSRSSYSSSESRSEVEDNLSKKLHNLLKDNSIQERREDKQERYEKYSKPRHRDPTHIGPPSLAQLETEGHYTGEKHLPNYTYEPTNKDEDEKKRELLFKFDILRKSYKNKEIPEYTIHSSIESMERGYEHTLKNLSIDSSVESYRRYLVMGFVGVEFIMCNIFKFDMTGFTQQQMISMESYERILIEIGEKSYSPSGSSLPAEVRLLFLLLMNSAMFILGKMISSKTGVNPINMFSQGMKSENKQKRKMKGPNIDINDL